MARNKLSINTFRGMQAPELSRRMNQVIKTENDAISAYETAGRERVSVASQLSEWGENTEDDAVSDISDKLGVLLAEMGEQEDVYAQNMEDYRALLKQIRNTEASVQPTRESREKIANEIQKLKYKEPSSTRIETLEQELVRAEAHNLVAEAQLTNVTRQKFKEAYDIHLAAVIERGEKQILLARHARSLLNCIDDTPVVPGDAPKAYDQSEQAKQVINQAEKDLRSWDRTDEPIQTSAGQMTDNLLPASSNPQDPSRAVNDTAVAQEFEDADGTGSVRTTEAIDLNNVEQQSKAQVSGGLAATREPIAA